MTILVHAVDRSDVPPCRMPDRFRTEIGFFMTIPGMNGAPATLGMGEYWIDPEDAARWYDDLVVEIVSPLDSQNKTEIELSDDHEKWLKWLIDNGVQHVRLVG
jgi:hypothetical protein